MSEIEETDGPELDPNSDVYPPIEETNEGHSKLPVSRRMSRETALRATYAIEMRGCTAEEVINDPLISEGQAISDFSKSLIDISLLHQEETDEIIRNKIERWEFHRVAIIDRLILRMAVTELLYFDEIPPKVSLNEAIEIGKKFSTENSGRFINGVLDSVYGDLKCGEQALQTGGNQNPD